MTNPQSSLFRLTTRLKITRAGIASIIRNFFIEFSYNTSKDPKVCIGSLLKSSKSSKWWYFVHTTKTFDFTLKIHVKPLSHFALLQMFVSLQKFFPAVSHLGRTTVLLELGLLVWWWLFDIVQWKLTSFWMRRRSLFTLRHYFYVVFTRKLT